MDPQQRLLLETASEALESAGLATDRLVGSATGVFVGITTSDYGQLLRQGGPENSDVYSATGSALNAAAGRISFTFGLQGPCVAVDTACSSSLVAVHLACQSLRTGESDLALAGGVNVILSPDAMVLFSKWGMMAPDGACKTFDAAADGFVRAEGCAVIVLKRLSDALAAGDPILAVIRGSAVNPDGRSSGLTVPNGPAQQAVLRKALASAGLAPADIDYVEAHGTGTSLGDPIEVEALGAVLRQGRARRPAAADRFGQDQHRSRRGGGGPGRAAEGGAGAAPRGDPAAPAFQDAEPGHSVGGAADHGADDARALAARRAAAPRRRELVRLQRHQRPRRAGGGAARSRPRRLWPALFVVPLSARDDAALRVLARRDADFIAADPTIAVADMATTMALGRAQLPRRCALVAETPAELERELRALAAGGTATRPKARCVPASDRRIAFLFTGQGAQYAGMGRGLYDSEPVFRAVIDRAAVVLAPLLERPLLEVLFPAEGATSPIDETALHPAGDVRARVRAGRAVALVGRDAGDRARPQCRRVRRGLCRRRLQPRGRARADRRARTPDAGAARAGRWRRSSPTADVSRRDGALSPTGCRSQRQRTGGDRDLRDAEARRGGAGALASRRRRRRALDVSHAFHSPLLDPMLDALEARAAVLPHASPRISLVSNLTGDAFGPGEAPDALTGAAMRASRCASPRHRSLAEAGVTALVEIGPHPTLLALAARAAPDANWTTSPSLRRGRDERREMLQALGRLYVRGRRRLGRVRARRTARRASCRPTRSSASAIGSTSARAATARDAANGHPLLGERRELAAAPGTRVWEREIGLESHPWLPTTACRARPSCRRPRTSRWRSRRRRGTSARGRVRSIENLKPMILREGVRRRVQTSLTTGPRGAAFSVHSRPVRRSRRLDSARDRGDQPGRSERCARRRA